jgi:putative transposase
MEFPHQRICYPTITRFRLPAGLRARGVLLPRSPRRQQDLSDFIDTVTFVGDQLQDGTRFRALTVVDVYTWESVVIEAGQSLKGDDVVRVLNRAKQ